MGKATNLRTEMFHLFPDSPSPRRQRTAQQRGQQLIAVSDGKGLSEPLLRFLSSACVSVALTDGLHVRSLALLVP